jgi:hypothetical protein
MPQKEEDLGLQSNGEVFSVFACTYHASEHGYLRACWMGAVFVPMDCDRDRERERSCNTNLNYLAAISPTAARR